MQQHLLRLCGTVCAVAAAVIPVAAAADTVGPIDFESPAYTLGDINAQNGWMKTGAFDVAVSSSLGTSGFGSQSLRISDAVTSGSFGDQTFATPLTDSAGESASTDGAFSAGTKQNHFEMQFDIASAMPEAEQSGMHMSVSPDRGDGSRMSYLRFEDQSDGIHVFFDDVTDAGPLGTAATFNESDIATISRAPHTIKLTMDFFDGPGNDVVKVYIDNVLKATGTSWEDYYRYDPESSVEQSPRILKTALFRESGVATPANQGNGFLIDNLSLMSGPQQVEAPAACPVGTTQSELPVETVVVSSAQSTPTLSSTALENGAQYLLVSSGTYTSSLNVADAEYTSIDNWATHMNGYDITPWMLGEGEFDLLVNGVFVNWGAYSGAHQYSYLTTGSGAQASFMVFDGDSNAGPSTISAGWYGDNAGSLDVAIYKCEAPKPAPQVHTFKFVDGVQATAENQTATFPMVTSWVSSTLGTVNDVPLTLSPTPWGPGVAYEASYIGGALGDDYSTHEVTSGNDVVGASCTAGTPFALVGYTTGDTMEAAAAGTPTTDIPAFTNLQSDKYVIVWNRTCPQLGSISGMKYNDLNRNGKKDANEPGLGGWTIRLIQDAVVIATTVTAADGTYSFSDLNPGAYVLREKHQKGWKRMSKNPPPIVLQAGDDVSGVYFGNATTRRGEREDTDRDDDRDDSGGGVYHPKHGHDDYSHEKDRH